MKDYIPGEPYWFILPLVAYPFEILVSMDEEDEIVRKRLIKYGDDEEEIKYALEMQGVGRFCLLEKNTHCIIGIKSLPNKYKLMGVIAHEVFHCVTILLDHIGMKMILETSDEAYAYLTGYICEEIYRKLKI